MGIDIDLYRLPRKQLEDELMRKIPKINDRVLLGKILDCFGFTCENSYVILCNEYYDDGNCFYNLPHVISRVFKLDSTKEDPFDVILKLHDEIIGYKDIYEAFEELGLDPEEYPDPDEEDY